MAHVNGLTALRTVGGDLTLESLQGVESASFLPTVTGIGGNLIINGLPKLDEVDLSGLESVGWVQIQNVGMTKLTWPFQTGGALALNAVDLEDLSALSECTSMSSLDVRNLDITDVDDLAKLTTVGSLTISGNHSLAHLKGLSGLTSTSSSLTVSNNDALLDLSGLDNVTKVGPESVDHAPREARRPDRAVRRRLRRTRPGRHRQQGHHGRRRASAAGRHRREQHRPTRHHQGQRAVAARGTTSTRVIRGATRPRPRR